MFKDKIKSLNYSEFSKHRQFLMGLSAVLIMLFHFSANYKLPDNPVINLLYDCNVGVEIFLLMSGIGLYFSFNNKQVDFKHYYIKRILNVYLVFLIINLPTVIVWDFVVHHNSFGQFFLDWFSFSNWTGKSHLGWYVSFAMMLYLIYPLIFKALKWAQKKKLDLILTVIFIVVWIAGSFLLRKYAEHIFNITELAVTRVPIFLIGCYLGQFVYEKKTVTWRLYAVAFAGVAVWFVIKCICGGEMIYGRYSHCLLAVSISLVLIVILNFVNIKPIYNFFSYLGTMSLELYLIHCAIMKNFYALVDDRKIYYYLIIIAVSFILSIFVSKLRKMIVAKYVQSISKS